jgi:hypothetical protein
VFGVQRAVGLVASQKTLSVAAVVLLQLPEGMVGKTCLASVPCVLAHLVQTVIDFLLVWVWMRAERKEVVLL